jgi:hypothetical protein
MLLSYAIQVPLDWKLPACLANVVLCLRWFDQRRQQCGDRLIGFKAGGGVDLSTGKLNFHGGKGLVLVFDARNYLTSIAHKCGKVGTIPNGSGINRDTHEFQKMWCDSDAEIALPPMKGTKIAAFFGSTTPNFFGYNMVNNKRKKNLVLEEIEQLETTYVAEAAATSGGGSANNDASIARELQDIEHKKNADAMDEARKKRVTKVAAQKEKRKM